MFTHTCSFTASREALSSPVFASAFPATPATAAPTIASSAEHVRSLFTAIIGVSLRLDPARPHEPVDEGERRPVKAAQAGGKRRANGGQRDPAGAEALRAMLYTA
jgi:hypothetical protein